MSDRAEARGPERAIDPLAALSAANPVPTGPVADPRRDPAAQALFEEIVMSNPDADTYVTGPQPRRKGRRTAAIAAAAAAVATLAFGATSILPGSSSTASAEVVGAAELTRSAGSGAVDVVIDLAWGSETGRLRMTTSWFDDDIELAIDLEGFTSIAERNGGEDLTSMRLRVVDGTFYVRQASMGEGWLRAGQTDLGQVLAMSGLLDDPTSIAGAGLVQLVNAAEDVREIGDGHYQGTVTMAELRSLLDMPAGLDMLATAGSGLADDQRFVLDVQLDDDGRVSQLAIGFEGAQATGRNVPVSATISTSYRQLGSGAPIEAPADARVLPKPDFDNPELAAAVQVMADVEQRRPGLCAAEVDQTGPDAVVQCFRNAGEPEAAGAFAEIIAGAETAGD